MSKIYTANVFPSINGTKIIEKIIPVYLRQNYVPPLIC